MNSNVANLLLKITGEPADAKRAIREVKEEAQAFASEAFKAEIGVEGVEVAEVRLRKLEATLAVFSKRSYSAKIKLDIKEAQAKLATLRGELALAMKGGVGARPLDDIVGDIARVGSDFESLGKQAESAGNGALDAGKKFAGWGLKLVGAGFAAIFVSAALVALAGVIGALVAALAVAVAGAALLAFGFAVTLLPALLLVVAGMARLISSSQKVQQEHQKEATAANAVKTARQGLSSANDQVTSSTQAVADAQTNLQQATTAAWQAYSDSIEKVKDDLLQVQYAQLGVQQADLNVHKAADALKKALGEAGVGSDKLDETFKKFTDVDFKSSAVRPGLAAAGGSTASEDDVRQKVIDLKRARLDQKGAQDTLHDSNQTLKQDHATELDYLSRGIEANDQYRAAVRQLADATTQQSKAADARRTAEAKLNTALANQAKIRKDSLVTPGLRRTAAELQDIKHKLEEAFGPDLDRIAQAALGTVHEFINTLTSPEVKPALDDLTGSIVGVFRKVTHELSRPGARHFFRELISGAAELARQLGKRAFISFVGIMVHLVEAVLPFVLHYARRIADAFEGWNAGFKNGDRLHHTLRRIFRIMDDVWGLIKAVARAFVAFVRDASGSGDGLVRTLTHMFDHLTKFLNTDEGREKVKQWLQDSIQFAKTFAGVLYTILDIMNKLLPVANKLIGAVQSVGRFAGRLRFGGQEKKAERQGLENDIGALNDTVIPKVNATRGVAHENALRLRHDLLHRIHQEFIETYGGAAGERGYGLLLRQLGLRRAWGGPIPGAGGFGDDTHVFAEGGEFMIRRAVAQSVGKPALEALNAGVPLRKIAAAHGGKGGGDTIYVTLPEGPPAHIPDARWNANELGKELARRGG